MHKQVPKLPFSFTYDYGDLRGAIFTDIEIAPAFDPQKERNKKYTKFVALWDTGATNSVITQVVVDELHLIPVGKINVETASGKDRVNTFFVNIALPNRVAFSNLKVSLGKIGGKADILIGMDIIHRGDFAITNYNNKTMFSFRIPSMESIDFVKKETKQIPVAVSPQIGRNDPCPCGSGKKYKNCCGKVV